MRRFSRWRGGASNAPNEYNACLFLRNADQKRYGGIRKRLASDYVLSSDDPAKADKIYPKGMVSMKRTMFDYEGESGEPEKSPAAPTENDGVAFGQNGR